MRNKLLIFSAILAVFGICVGIGQSQSVWFDEAYSVNVAQHSFSQVINLAKADVHPPLYYLLLKVWTMIFGQNDVSWRSLSALCAALAAGVGLLLVKRIFGERAPVWAWPFVVLAPFLLRYGFEVRMYALGSLIVISATYILLRAMAEKRLWLWVLYAFLLIAGLYTQYFIGAAFVAHFIWCLYVTWKHGQLKVFYKQPWLWAFLGAGLCFLPWLPIFIAQNQPTHGYSWQPTPDYRSIVNVFTFALSFLAQWHVRAWQNLLTFGAILIEVYFIVRAWLLTRERSRQTMILLALTSLVPLVLLYILSLPPRRSIFIERYMALSILAGYVLVGASIALVIEKSRRQMWLAVAVIVVLIQGVFNLARAGNFNYTRLLKPQMRPVAQYLQVEHAEKDMIVVNEPQLWYELHAYWRASDIYFYNKDGDISSVGGYAVLHNSALQIHNSNDIKARRIWYVVSSGSPFRTPVPAGLRPTATRVQFGGYSATLYTR